MWNLWSAYHCPLRADSARQEDHYWDYSTTFPPLRSTSFTTPATGFASELTALILLVSRSALRLFLSVPLPPWSRTFSPYPYRYAPCLPPWRTLSAWPEFVTLACSYPQDVLPPPTPTGVSLQLLLGPWLEPVHEEEETIFLRVVDRSSIRVVKALTYSRMVPVCLSRFKLLRAKYSTFSG